ncbi:hypothetical protein [Salipaludibacillus daqingensis]|uniref:hypothetical protein n=1 Tax=Salipaludibacillus daqingensis TaxID=3041001 RepID=UPI002475ECF5|nr:hypothetical protein [Salipaludibacillus daqingensis]
MAKVYTGVFHHSVSGVLVRATYDKKMLVMEVEDELTDANEDIYFNTESWIGEHNHQRFETWKSAQQFLRSMGNDVEFDLK